MKRFGFFAAVVLCLSILASVAFAGTSVGGGNGNTYTGDSALMDRLRKAPEFKFWIHHSGIGYGNCPVYTAPSEDSFRCANGKASCSTNEEIGEAGFVSGWLLVRYETNNGGVRVGYIPPKYVRGFQSEMSSPKFDYIPATASGDIIVTDNPLMQGSSYAMLYSGEPFFVLGKYTYYGDWWYIECVVDGQIARGFIDRESSYFSLGNNGGLVTGNTAEYSSYGSQTTAGQSTTVISGSTLGNPSVSLLGTSQMGDVTIGYGTTGDRKIVRQDADPDSSQVAVVYPGSSYPCYGSKQGSTGKLWYYIWVDENSAWGWVSSGYATLN